MKKLFYLLIAVASLSLLVTAGCKKKKTEEKFAPVSSVQAVYSDGIITVNWGTPQNASPSNYKLYRNNELIQTLTNTSYTDVILESGAYKYAVIAVYPNGESEKSYSNQVSVNEDNTTAIAGVYLGDISVSPVNGYQLDTIKNVSIELRKVNTTTAIIELDETIYIPTLAMQVPLNFNQEVEINKEGNNYVFTISSTVSVPPIPLPVPITVEGIVTDNILTLTFDVNLSVTTVSAKYVGTKQ